jgi:hypothetical protein
VEGSSRRIIESFSQNFQWETEENQERSSVRIGDTQVSIRTGTIPDKKQEC